MAYSVSDARASVLIPAAAGVLANHKRQEYGYDVRHHRSKVIRRRPETSMNARVPAFR